MNVDNFVINIKSLEDIEKNSIGLINAINGNFAMVYFVGKNTTLRVNFSDLKEIDIEKTGKGYDFKICNICHILKPTNSFSINQTDASGRKTTRPSCNDCRKIIDGYRLKTQESKKLIEKEPPKNSIFICPICKKRSIVGITANLVKDHDHKTGNAREWICDSCNTGLGRFQDNISFLQRAIEYLKKYEITK